MKILKPNYAIRNIKFLKGWLNRWLLKTKSYKFFIKFLWPRNPRPFFLKNPGVVSVCRSLTLYTLYKTHTPTFGGGAGKKNARLTI